MSNPDDLYSELKFRFEIEHVFAEGFYSDLGRATALESFGFFQQMRANQIGLFSDADSVTAFQNAPIGAIQLLTGAGNYNIPSSKSVIIRDMEIAT